MRFKNHIALITGISKGLGKAMAEALLAEGAKVIGWGLTSPSYNHDNLHFVECDIRDQHQVESAWKKTQQLSSRIDFLINNAGLGRFAPVEKLDPQLWHQMIDINLTGAFLVTRLVVPSMKEAGQGHIVNISSIAGRVGSAQGEGYNASKFGLAGFSEALFQELRSFGIKVSTVYPGSAATNFFDEIPAIDIHDNMMRPQDVAATVLHLLDTPPNYLIREVEMRPLNAKPPQDQSK